MKTHSYIRILILALISSALLISGCASLPANTPYSQNALSESEIGVLPFSGKIDLQGDQIEQSISIATKNEIQWLAIELDWAMIWNDELSAVDTKLFNAFLEQASIHEIKIMISISNAPMWAMEENGPSPKATAELIYRLANTYPAIGAVELFPGANTQTGWGATPAPAAYMDMLAYASIALDATGRDIKLIAGGFYPAVESPGSVEESTFLQEMYVIGPSNLLDQISLRYPAGSLQPGENNSPPLSRYEKLRFIMLQQGHQNGTLWITSFTWPVALEGEDTESAWLAASYDALRSHLYLETIVFDSLNPSGLLSGQENNSLIGRNGKLHSGVIGLLQTPYGNNTELITAGAKP